MASLALSYTPCCTLHGTCFVYHDMTHTPPHQPQPLALPPAVPTILALRKHQQLGNSVFGGEDRQKKKKKKKKTTPKHEYFPIPRSRSEIWVNAESKLMRRASVVGAKKFGVVILQQCRRNWDFFFLFFSVGGLLKDWALDEKRKTKRTKDKVENDEMKFGHDVPDRKPPPNPYLFWGMRDCPPSGMCEGASRSLYLCTLGTLYPN